MVNTTGSQGQVWEPSSMIEALNGGIGIIVQENGTISEISVAENIFLGELKQFAGVNYFESRKIEDFSPLFDLDTGSIEQIKQEYAKQLTGKSGAEAKKLLSQETAEPGPESAGCGICQAARNFGGRQRPEKGAGHP